MCHHFLKSSFKTSMLEGHQLIGNNVSPLVLLIYFFGRLAGLFLREVFIPSLALYMAFGITRFPNLTSTLVVDVALLPVSCGDQESDSSSSSVAKCSRKKVISSQ